MGNIYFMRFLTLLEAMLITVCTASVGYASPPITKPAVQKAPQIEMATFLVQAPATVKHDFAVNWVVTEKRPVVKCFFINYKVALPTPPLIAMHGYKYLRWCEGAE